MEWLDQNVLYWHWIVLGLALCAIEIFIPTFFILWFGISALVVGAVMWVVPFTFTWQLATWASLAVVDLIIWQRYVSPRIRDKTRSGMALEAMLGQVGTVLDHKPEQQRGRLRFSAPILGSDEWTYICSQETRAGDRVRVKDFSGNTLIVEKL